DIPPKLIFLPKEDADPPEERAFSFPGDMPQHLGLSITWVDQTRKKFQKSCFTGSVCSHEAYDLAPINFKIGRQESGAPNILSVPETADGVQNPFAFFIGFVDPG